MIATGWPTARLKNLVEPIQTGVWGVDPKGDADDVLCVRVADFDRQRFGLKSVETVRSVAQKDRAPRLLQAGDILLEKSGGTDANPVGFTVMFDGHYPAVSSNFIGRIRMRPGQHPRFWLYALAASYFTRRTQKCVRQTTGIQNLDQSAFFSEVFAVPPLEDQRAIADFLDRETARIDTLIDEQQRLIELLRERRLAAITESVVASLVTDRVEQSSEWYPSLPSGWGRGRVKSVASRVTDGAHISPDTVEGVFDFVSTKDLDRGSIRFDACLKTTPETYEYMVRTGCQPRDGDVLFSKDGTVGATAVVRGDHPFVVASSLVIITPDPQRMDADYLAYVFASKTALEQAASMMRGAGLPRLSVGNLARVEVPIPPLDEQRRISVGLDRQIAKIDNLIAETERCVDLARERRSALITAAVSGQADLQAVG